jgi:hypothetical protein
MSARIELLESRRSANCVIRRLSDVEAVLEVAEPHGLPIEFDLLIGPGERPQRCGVIRRGARSIAVAFI